MMMHLVWKVIVWVRCPLCRKKYKLVFNGSEQPDISGKLKEMGWTNNPENEQVEQCPNPKCVKERKEKIK